MAKQTRKTFLKKVKRTVLEGIIYIQATFNNTIVTITDLNGEVLSWSSAGACGFKGARKATFFAGKTAVETAARRCVEERKMQQVTIMIKGIGPGRKSVFKGIGSFLKITSIKDVTPIAHNGCRPPKKRRT